MTRAAWWLAALAVAAGCGPAIGGAPTTEPAAASKPSSPLLDRRGEVLELSIPLVGGGRMNLAELRGRPVLLELSDATCGGRDDAQARYRTWLEQHERAFAVVTVGLDPDAADLPAGWTDAPPPFVLGWDPQGALAARLQLVTLPTVVLLDGDGRIVDVHEGTPPDDAAIERWLGQGMVGATHA